jgi:aquaporin Z
MSTRPNLQPVTSGPVPVERFMERPRLNAMESVRAHWPEYAIEAALLGGFMISACVFGALYEFPESPVRQAISSQLLRRVLMGISMGLTAVALTYSPWGKQSGAHYNPSITLTFWRLGKTPAWDACFYILFQFVGGVLGVMLVAAVVGRMVADPAVNYVVTIPGPDGPRMALVAEFVIAFGMMTVVLNASNHHKLHRFTGVFAGLLVAIYITFEAPFSGMSMNPARTIGSAYPANIWTAMWIYFTAPPLGMLTAAELYLWHAGHAKVKCCKLHHDNEKRCIFCGANGGYAR